MGESQQMNVQWKWQLVGQQSNRSQTTTLLFLLLLLFFDENTWQSRVQLKLSCRLLRHKTKRTKNVHFKPGSFHHHVHHAVAEKAV